MVPYCQQKQGSCQAAGAEKVGKGGWQQKKQGKTEKKPRIRVKAVTGRVDMRRFRIGIIRTTIGKRKNQESPRLSIPADPKC
jgi:hypothetical protein